MVINEVFRRTQGGCHAGNCRDGGLLIRPCWLDMPANLLSRDISARDALIEPSAMGRIISIASSKVNYDDDIGIDQLSAFRGKKQHQAQLYRHR